MSRISLKPADHTKRLYDMMLGRTHETARRLEERVQKVVHHFTATSTSQNQAQDCRRMLVLIVEDNADQADSLAMVLRLWGFETEIAYDAAEALEMAARDHPDAILADIGLPGSMDGFELARRLKEKPELKDVPIAAVTGYADAESREKSKAAGMIKHFAKPADLAALHRLLDDRRDTLLGDLSPGCN
jgi:CheY-like chemotaxis protein